jgi:Leucine-rich repeat (LRR) protein
MCQRQYKKSILRHSGHLKRDADRVRPVEPSVIVYLKRLSQGKPQFFDGLLILTSLTTKQRSLDGQGYNWKLFSKSGA